VLPRVEWPQMSTDGLRFCGWCRAGGTAEAMCGAEGRYVLAEHSHELRGAPCAIRPRGACRLGCATQLAGWLGD